MRLFFYFIAALSLISPNFAAAQDLSPGTLSAKAFLEDLVVRRYTQDLGTRVDKNMFSISAFLDVTEVKPVPDKKNDVPEEPISDLMLGTLDPEELIKKFAPGEEKAAVQGLLKNFRVKTVRVNVGTRDDVTAETKTEIDKWLKARLKTEFGRAGKGTLGAIASPIVKPPEPEGILDQISKLQNLLGQLALAFAILIGIVLFKVLSKQQAGQQSVDLNLNSKNAMNHNGGAGAEAAGDKKENSEETETAALTWDYWKMKVAEVAPQLKGSHTELISSWCESGKEGLLKTVLFAEAVSKDVGRLPIPTQARDGVKEIFTSMPARPVSEKVQALQQAYWDILKAVNLGAESLKEPFGYLNQTPMETVNQVLKDQSGRLRVLASLYMSDDTRSSYLQGLSEDGKKEILQSAASLTEMGQIELKTMDVDLAGKIAPSKGSDKISFSQALAKICGSLDPYEELQLLQGVTGKGLEEYRRTTPSVAFLHLWPEAALSKLMSRVTTDELVVYLRIQSSVRDRLLASCPPLTVTMVNDELQRQESTRPEVRSQRLLSLASKMQKLHDAGEVNLESLAPASSPEAVRNVA